MWHFLDFHWLWTLKLTPNAQLTCVLKWPSEYWPFLVNNNCYSSAKLVIKLLAEMRNQSELENQKTQIKVAIFANKGVRVFTINSGPVHYAVVSIGKAMFIPKNSRLHSVCWIHITPQNKHHKISVLSLKILIVQFIWSWWKWTVYTV